MKNLNLSNMINQNKIITLVRIKSKYNKILDIFKCSFQILLIMKWQYPEDLLSKISISFNKTNHCWANFDKFLKSSLNKKNSIKLRSKKKVKCQSNALPKQKTVKFKTVLRQLFKNTTIITMWTVSIISITLTTTMLI